MRAKRKLQFELPGAGEVFNLAGQQSDDPWRLECERWAQAEREREGREYSARMQLSLAQCPGFIGCDAPASDEGTGRVVVEPAHVFEAMAWLKRRYHVAENLDLSPDNGLCIELKPRVRNKTGCGRPRTKLTVHFGKPEQFELGLNTEK